VLILFLEQRVSTPTILHVIMRLNRQFLRDFSSINRPLVENPLIEEEVSSYSLKAKTHKG
jgi:hypothetical protein